MARIKKIRRSSEFPGPTHFAEFSIREHVANGYFAHRRGTRTANDSDHYLSVALKNYVDRFDIPKEVRQIPKKVVGAWLHPNTLVQIERVAYWMGLSEEEALEKVIETFLTRNGYTVNQELIA